MNTSKKIISFFILIVLMSSAPHRYYVSLTEIRIDTTKKTFNASCKLFTDDLEDALLKINKKKVDIASQTNNKEVLELLNKYMIEHFKIFMDNKIVNYKFIGCDIEDNSTWCYLEMENYSSANEITIMNSFLYDFLPEQSNVIQLMTT